MKLSKTQILGIVLIITAAIIIINPPIVTYDILLPDGKYTAKLGIRDFLAATFRFEAVEKYRLESISIEEETYQKMQYLANLTNTYLETDKSFSSVYSKFRSKYQYIQVCYEKLPRNYVCGTYVLYPKAVILSTYISANYPTILMSKESFDLVYSFYSQKKFRAALDAIVTGYKEGKVIFVNTNIIEFLSALA